jgi:DoxX-like family
MATATLTASVPAGRSWTGRTFSVLVTLFMLFDTVIHLTKPAVVAQAFAQLQVPMGLSVGLGVIELVCTVLYAIPRTSVIGAVLLTGYLGGATAIQLRADGGVFPIIFPSIVGVLLWAGLLLRNESLRAFVTEGIRGN